MKPNRSLNDTELHEQLSALMDDELDDWQVRKLLQAAEHDPQVLTTLTELQQQKAARTGLPTMDVLADVNQAIDEQATQQRLYRRYQFRGMAIGAMSAMAATVVVAVGALVFWPTSPGGLSDPASVTEASPTDLNQYWQVHAQYATFQAGSRWDETDTVHTEVR